MSGGVSLPAEQGGGRLRRLTSSLAEGFGLAIIRFPFASLLLAGIAALSNLEIQETYPFGRSGDFDVYQALAAGAAASVVAGLFAQAAGARGAARLAVAFAAAAGIGLLVWFGAGRLLFAPPLLVVLILAVPLAPFIGRPSAARFWTFTLWTGFGVSLGFVSVMLFVLGISAILEMIRYLFDVGITSKAYQHIYATAATLVGPLFALGRIPTAFDDDSAFHSDVKDRTTAGVRVLQDWVASPLVLVAALVLHLYAAKILATGAVPKNQIGWIVTAYSIFVLSQRIAADPFIARGGFATRVFGRLWAAILVVPVVLLGCAAWFRIAAEGLTLERYYLALAGISALLIVAAQIVRRVRGDIRLMAAIPLALLALSSFGPWGVMSTVGRSQIALIGRDFSGGDGRVAVKDLDDERRQALRSRVGALDDVQALPRLLPLLTDADRASVAATETQGDLRVAVFGVLGLDYAAQATQAAGVRNFISTKTTLFDVEGFDLVMSERYLAPADAPPADATIPALVLSGSDLVVRVGGAEDRVALGPVLAALPPSPATKGADDPDPYVADVTTANHRHLRLRITSFSLNEANGAPFFLVVGLALRGAEWPSLRRDGER